MMALGPNFPVSTNPALSPGEGGEAAAEGDPFAQLLVALGDGPPPDGVVKAAETIPDAKNLTIKTFRKLLDGNPVPEAPIVAPGTEDSAGEKGGAEAAIPGDAAAPQPPLRDAPPDAQVVPPMIADLLRVAEPPAAPEALPPEAPSVEQQGGESEPSVPDVAPIVSTIPAPVPAASAPGPAAPVAAAPTPKPLRPAIESNVVPETTVDPAKTIDPAKPADPSAPAAAPVAAQVVQLFRNQAKAPAGEAPQPIAFVPRPLEGAAPRVAEAAPPALELPAAAPANAAPVLAVMQPSVQPAAAPAQPFPATTAPADQAIEQQLDLAHEGEWLDQLARDISRTAGRDGAMRFRLHPETLGHLNVELTQGSNGTSLRLSAETEAARAILADAQPRLLAEARAQGVRIAESHVDLGGQGTGANDPRRQETQREETLLGLRGGRSASPAATVDEPASSERYA